MTAIQGIIDAADEELKLREATSSRDAIKVRLELESLHHNSNLFNFDIIHYFVLFTFIFSLIFVSYFFIYLA